MEPNERKTAPLGELVAAIFDKAAALGEDPTETSRLATIAVMHFWLRNRKQPPAQISHLAASR